MYKNQPKSWGWSYFCDFTMWLGCPFYMWVPVPRAEPRPVWWAVRVALRSPAVSKPPDSRGSVRAASAAEEASRTPAGLWSSRCPPRPCEGGRRALWEAEKKRLELHHTLTTHTGQLKVQTSSQATANTSEQLFSSVQLSTLHNSLQTLHLPNSLYLIKTITCVCV